MQMAKNETKRLHPIHVQAEVNAANALAADNTPCY
jgi:hypothetical protein